jgi:mono/diheme cytochrome c family protein
MRTAHCVFEILLLVLVGAYVSNVQAQRPSVDPKLAAQGRTLFQRKGCSACHTIGKKGRMPGPDLLGVTERRTLTWLRQLIKTPEQMAVSDSTARSLVREYNQTKMPNAKLSDQEVEALIQYLATRSGAPGP